MVSEVAMKRFIEYDDDPPKTSKRTDSCTRCGKGIDEHSVFLNGWTFCTIWCQHIFFDGRKR